MEYRIQNREEEWNGQLASGVLGKSVYTDEGETESKLNPTTCSIVTQLVTDEIKPEFSCVAVKLNLSLPIAAVNPVTKVSFTTVMGVLAS